MQKHKKLRAKILSLALSVAMVTTMLPMTAFAADPSLAHDISGGSLSLATDDGCSVGTPHVVTGASTTNFITAASGEHWVTLAGVIIDASATTGSGGSSGVAGESAFDLQGTSTVHLTLKGGTTNTLTGGTERAAIQVRKGTSLVIDGAGQLDATATSAGAGIGASASIAMGSITIKGGIINAIGTGNPGIGCMTKLTEGGTIIIESGTVTTTCASAYGGGINTGKGGTITISGGNISATSKDPFAAIGSGSTGTIEISGSAVVTAIAEVGAGIGGDGADMFNSGGTINITGGTITATSGSGAGIGSGGGTYDALGAAGGTVTISGGTVTATSSAGAGIGGGMFGAGGTINITGGTVIARNNGMMGYGIGGMDASNQPSGDVKISNGAKVTAVSTTAGNAIADTDGSITPADSGTVANVMQFDFALATPENTAIEVKDSSGNSLNPAVSYAPDAVFQSLALTAPTVGNYTAYQGGSKLTFRPVGGSSSETFPVVTGLNKYTDVLGPDITIAKALTINTAKPASGKSIITTASAAPTGATASRLTWVDAEGNTVAGNTVIQESTVYKSTHVFTAKTGYAFDSAIAESDITVTNIGAGSKTVALSADHKILTVVVTWPETLVLPAYTGTQAPAPDATTESKTEISIKLKGITVSGQTIEYAKSTTNVAPTADADWQTSTTFNNLTKGTTYYFFARVSMNTSHKAGTASAGTPITTNGAAALTTITVGGDNPTSGYETANAATLQKAFTSCPDGGTVKLGANISTGGGGGYVENKAVTLDLNGKTLTCYEETSGAPVIALKGSASLIIDDSSSAKNGAITTSSDKATIFHQSTGELKILAGTISGSDSAPAIECTNSSGTIKIEGGTVSTDSTVVSTILLSGGKITMTGGTVTGTSAMTAWSTIQITEVPTPAAIVLDIQGGTVSNTGTMEFPGAAYNSVVFPTTVTAENRASYYSHTGGTVGTVVPAALTHDIGTASLTLVADDGCAQGNPHIVTGTTTVNTIEVTSGTHFVTLDGVSIATTKVGGPFQIKAGTVNLTLAGANTLTARDASDGEGYPGLLVMAGTELTIDGTGALTATGYKNSMMSHYGAGIGGGSAAAMKNVGTITIHGGTITASGGYGIGTGASDGTAGALTISGENTVVTATGLVGTAAVASTDLTLTGMVAKYKVDSDYTGATNISDNKIYEGTAQTTEAKDVKITFASGTADKTALTAAITAANSAKTGITVSDSAASSVPSGTKFVTTAEMQALTDAIAAAQAVANNPASTAAQVSAAVTALNSAVATFHTAIKTGTDSSGGGSTGGGGSTSSGSNVTVDGKTESIGKVENSTTTTTVVVDSAKLDSKVEGAKSGSSVVVPVTSTKDSAAAQLVVESVEKMAAKDMTLEVKAGKTTYALPAAAIDTAGIVAKLGATDAAKVPFTITITSEKNVKVEGATVVGTPTSFTVTATYGGKSVTVDRFDTMVARTMEITATQAKQVTTAVVVDANGVTRHVPTNVYQSGGKWYAKVNSMTNSTYALIENKSTFTDLDGQWYAEQASELSARKVTEGVFPATFDGGKDITRAEFAALLVNGLGLPKTANADFSDVSADAWYSKHVATAVEYGIVNGIGGNRFAPNTTITRQEAMVMLSRAAQVMSYAGKTGELTGFSDVADVGAWAVDGAKFSVGSGLIVGNNGKLMPRDNITRGETATVVLRLLQQAGLVDVRAEA